MATNLPGNHQKSTLAPGPRFACEHYHADMAGRAGRSVFKALAAIEANRGVSEKVSFTGGTWEPSADVNAAKELASGTTSGAVQRGFADKVRKVHSLASVRIETVTDAKSGQVYAEVYSGDNAAPLLRSEPAFASHDELVDQVLQMCRTHFPDHTPFADDPTIGV